MQMNAPLPVEQFREAASASEECQKTYQRPQNKVAATSSCHLLPVALRWDYSN